MKLDPNKLEEIIENTLNIAHDMISKSEHYRVSKEPMASVIIVLRFLKGELKRDPNNINKRVLRAMHDIGATAVKVFENTPLDDGIEEVTGYLYQHLKGYKELEPLRMDFGKGKPI